MPESRRETIETRDMSDRELMLNIYHEVGEVRGEVGEVRGQLKELNGTVARHSEEIYGCKDRDIPGLKPTQQDIKDFVAALKTMAKTLGYLAGIFGAGNIAALTFIAAKVF